MNKEISMYKVFCWLKSEDEFYKILSLKFGKEEINRLMKRGAKDQRKERNSSWKNVKKQIPFDQIYEKKCKSFLS